MIRTSFDAIPIVDLAAIDDPEQRPALADELCRTCHEVGFAVLSNHGISSRLVDDVFDLMERFFALDDSDKRLIDKRRSPHFRGWEAVGSEFTNNRVDVREQIDVWSEWPTVAPDEPSDTAPLWSRLLGPNQWMPEKLLADHRRLTLRWMHELGSLADRILELFAVGLELEPDHFARRFGDHPMSLTKMIHYPPTPDGGAGVNAHHDTGFVTLLAPGPTPGLQVLNPHGTWIDAPSVPDTFVLNVGEMLQAMTGNYLAATAHRVIAHEERLSTAYFHGPSLDTELVPIELAARFGDAVAASERHRTAGFMASRSQTESGTGDMASDRPASTYGTQLWNYFARSYPDNMAAHHGGVPAES